MNPLDQAVKNQEEKKKSAELWAKDILARDVHAPLKSLVGESPGNLKDSENYLPTLAAALDKAERSGFATDMEIMSLLQQGRQTLDNNPSAIRAGMKRYNELTWRDLLNKRGEFDRNKAAHLVNEIRGYLNCGRGCRRSMEYMVRRLESRIAFLLESQGQFSDGGNGAPAGIQTPEPTNLGPGDAGVAEFDPRVR